MILKLEFIFSIEMKLNGNLCKKLKKRKEGRRNGDVKNVTTTVFKETFCLTEGRPEYKHFI